MTGRWTSIGLQGTDVIAIWQNSAGSTQEAYKYDGAMWTLDEVLSSTFSINGYVAGQMQLLADDLYVAYPNDGGSWPTEDGKVLKRAVNGTWTEALTGRCTIGALMKVGS
jgi:hypothetical protein